MVSIFKRETLELIVDVEDEGGAKNLTDAEASWRLTVPFGDDILEKDTSGNDLNVVDEEGGLIELYLSSDDTDIDAGTYRHIMRVIDVDARNQVVLFEDFEVKETHE